MLAVACEFGVGLWTFATPSSVTGLFCLLLFLFVVVMLNCVLWLLLLCRRRTAARECASSSMDELAACVGTRTGVFVFTLFVCVRRSAAFQMFFNCVAAYRLSVCDSVLVVDC